MKKLVTIILILALLLPAAAGALGKNDRIVGFWYMFMDGTYYPEVAASYGGYDYALSAYFFSPDGTISLLENDIKDGVATPTFMSCGKWEKSGFNKYSAQILGIGDCTIDIEDNGNMYLTLLSTKMKVHLRLMIYADPYRDYSY